MWHGRLRLVLLLLLYAATSVSVCPSLSCPPSPQEVDFVRAQQYADSIGAVCIETSAKTNVHVHDAFVDIGACTMVVAGSYTRCNFSFVLPSVLSCHLRLSTPLLGGLPRVFVVAQFAVYRTLRTSMMW